MPDYSFFLSYASADRIQAGRDSETTNKHEMIRVFFNDLHAQMTGLGTAMVASSINYDSKRSGGQNCRKAWRRAGYLCRFIHAIIFRVPTAARNGKLSTSDSMKTRRTGIRT